MEPADLAFVYSSWLKSLRPHSSVYKYLFFKGQHALITRILQAPKTVVTVCTLPDTPDVILGWVCCQPGVVHYVYVKADFRQMGLASTLLHAALTPIVDLVYTHYTPAVKYFVRYTANYDPYLLWGL